MSYHGPDPTIRNQPRPDVDIDLARDGATKVDAALGVLAHMLMCDTAECAWCADAELDLWLGVIGIAERGLDDLDRAGIRSHQRAA